MTNALRSDSGIMGGESCFPGKPEQVVLEEAKRQVNGEVSAA